MEKKLKDYALMYLMCEVVGQFQGEERKGYLTGVTNGGEECEIQFFDEEGINVFEEPEYNTMEQVKLCLYPLSEILQVLTTDQKIQLLDAGIMYSHAGDRYIIWKPEAVRRACSFRVDLFELIPAGLAVDARYI